MIKKRFFNFILFMIFLVIEVLIALYVHDDFVRPYLGDVLVVVVLYFFARIWIPEKYRWLPGAIFVFAAAVEVLQSGGNSGCGKQCIFKDDTGINF